MERRSPDDTLPRPALRGRDFLTLRAYTPGELRFLLGLASEIKSDPRRFAHSLEGKALAVIFEKPSLRTRVTFEVGIHQLGGFAIHLAPTEINLGRRESIYDVARNLERMVQGIMIRTFAHEVAEQLAEYASIPVINGLTDACHPCQGLADYLTMQEVKGRLEGLKVAFVGDGNNVANSLLFGAAQLGVRIAVASPPGYEPRSETVEWVERTASTTGAACLVTSDPVEAVRQADVIYTDVWTSMGQEHETDVRRRVFASYQVNERLVAHARPDAVFMHCLPAHRGEEVTAEVIDSPRSVVFQQAENRLHAQKAILHELL
jgi:ornithine carbamoyltransferase